MAKKVDKKKAATKPSSNEPPATHDFLVVGIGASAGGIQALREFFEHVPLNSGMAYVVILHLSPDHDSKLAEVLQQTAKIPVTQVREKVYLESNQVYVVPPNQHLLMHDGYVTVSPNTAIEDRRAPVDIFFRTLADSHGAKAVCVVLSGTGANGSMGLKRIKERGGAAFVQNPREAEFNEMPRNAIATELVDEVLPVAQIPQKIIDYGKGLRTIQIPLEAEERGEDQQQALREIFLQLRLRTGHDFTNYKRPTLLRRIERRINIRSLGSLPAYAAYLKDSPDEITALLKDLLISVTNFFRDKKAFETLEQEVIPRILHGKTSEEQVRIWVAGCATGEEAYSLAILLAEKALGAVDAPKIQIFATDIDGDAIVQAREGLYTINDAADVSPERLRRFFTKEGDDYRIRRELREMILFANHNFLKDPPFSHLDLVSCRNVMIYLNGIAQERVVETFHFALNPGSFLFLGTSESVDGASDLYSVFNRELHIYQSREVGMRSYPVPESVPAFRLEQSVGTATQNRENKVLERITFGDLHQRLLEEYAPPSLVVNEEYDIVHLSGNAGKYLQISGGEPSQNLLKLIREELRLELRSALYQAVQQGVAVEARGVKVRFDDRTETVNVHVRPVLRHDDTARGYMLVVFEPSAGKDDSKEVLLSSAEPISRHLEEELMGVKAQLRTSVEQHEFQAEELKASNEELQAMNEELRSAAEELETSKEELQSINEELRAVNQELKIKIEETTLSSNNLRNLVNSTNIATVFLDRSFRVVLFTPSARQLFNLIPTDYGRPLTDITHRMEYRTVLDDAETVLQKLQPVEKEVETTDGQTYLMRILPYRTGEDRINGVVISFINITERKEIEKRLYEAEKNYSGQLEREVSARTAELAESREQYASLVENTPDVITRWNKDLKLLFANSAFAGKTGFPVHQLYGKTNQEMGQADGIAVPYMNSLRKAFQTGEPVEHFNSYPTPHGETQYYSRIVPEKNKQGEVETVLAIARDITDIKNAEGEILLLKDALVRRATDKYLTLFNAIDEAVVWCELITDEAGKAVDYRMLEMNPAFEKMTGITREAAKGKTAKEVVPTLEDWWVETYARVALEGETVRFENRVEELNRWFDFYASPVGAGADKQFVVVYSDVSERKHHEQQQEYLIKLSDVLRSIDDPLAIEGGVTKMAMDYFGADRCYYNTIEGDNAIIRRDAVRGGLPSVAGTYPLNSFARFKKAVDEGRPLIVQDAATSGVLDEGLRELCLQMKVISFVDVPVVKNGKAVGILCLVQSAPRHWTETEILLAAETAERTWAAVERAKAEEGLRQSEERFRTLANAVPQVMWSNDENGVANYFNQRWYDYSGLTYGQSLGLGWEAIVHPDDAPASTDKWHTALAAGEIFDTEYRLRRSDGNYRWHIGRNVPLKDGTGRVLGWFGSATDIEDLKSVQEALSQSEARLKVTMESATDYAIITTDTEGRIERWSSGASQIFGYTEEEVLGSPAAIIFTEEDRKAGVPQAEMETARTTGRAADERWHRRKDGSRFYTSGVMRPIYNQTLSGYVKVARDMTNQQLFTEELHRLVAERTAELQRSNEDLRQFAHVASHDLKEPVRKIKTFNNRVLDEFGEGLPEKAKSWLEKVDLSTDRMISMIDGVLRYSKLGSTEFLVQEVDLNETIREIKLDLEVLIQQKEAVITATALPTLVASAVLMYQLFYNLLLNSLKFAKPGVPSRINISCAQTTMNEKRFYVIVLSDNGIGFEPEFEETIFKTFTRLNPADEYEGTGLGLALCKKIVERHGGTISAAGQPGEGAIFTVLLPAI